ncbi:MAG: hypothetical protein ISN28_01350 [Ectothiorhodospiraceae bacterium AqS1]|nr:hypothetical protein [Ectothiorhodospiraceae bacterium AqS1]
MNQDQQRKTFGEGKPDWLEEPCNRALSAQDVVQLLNTQAFFDLLGQPYPATREGVIERLERENLIDRTVKGYSIRRIGALLLAKRMEDFPFEIGAKAPRVVVYSGNSKMGTKLGRIQGDGYAVGFERLVQFIMEQIPQREVIDDALRKKIQLVPEVPVRELVANALIHQDFTLTGIRVMIDIYADRVEISSPGIPLTPLNRIIDGRRPQNQRLASIMRDFSIGEGQGGGIDKAIRAMEMADLPLPEFRATSLCANVVLRGRDPFDEMNRNARVAYR